jgi:Fic family protein
MVNLYLAERKLLKYPTLYISYFLKRNRIEYYDRLSEVREKGNYEQWVKFFLQAIAESALDAIEAIDLLVELHDKNYEKVSSIGKASKTALKVFEYVEKSPIIDIKKTCLELGVAYNTVASAVENLVKIGVLEQVGDARRSRCFAYESYLKILRKGT